MLIQTKNNSDNKIYITFLTENIDLIDFSKPKKNPILIGCIENKLTNIDQVQFPPNLKEL